MSKELVEYVAQLFSEGRSSKDVRAALLDAGYSAKDADELIEDAVRLRFKKAMPFKGSSSTSDYVGQLEGYADALIKIVPYPRMALWKGFFFHPVETMKHQKGKEDLRQAAKDVAVASLPSSLIMGVFAAAYVLILGSIPIFAVASKAYGSLGGFGAIALSCLLLPLLFVVLELVFSVVSWLLSSGFYFVVAKLLGGTGSYRRHAYLNSLLTCSILLVNLLLLPFAFIPCVGYLAYAVSFALMVYMVYLQYKLVLEVHGLSNERTLAVVLAPIALAVVLAVVLFVFYFAFILALFAGGVAAAGASAAASP